MRKTISRNIAIVSAIFIVVFSVMLVTNYFKVSNTDALEMVERLKLAHEELGENPQLQEQIRELDLLARRAHFISMGRLRIGVVLLLFMVVIFAISLRIYFEKSKDIPDKNLDPIDDWAIQSRTRIFIVWITSGLAVSGLVFALLTSPYLKNLSSQKADETEYLAQDFSAYETSDFEDSEQAEEAETADTAATSEAIQVSNVTHNAFRGNRSLGLSSARNVPTSWNLATGQNILWRIPSPRKGYNSPIINGNKVFFTGADENVRELFCF